MSENLKVVLASASPARRDLLINAGINPIIINSNLDEVSVLKKLSAQSSAEKVIALARAKPKKLLPSTHYPMREF